MSRFIARASGTATTSGTTCAATVTTGTVGATAIVVIVASNQFNLSAALVSSVADTAGNTYTKAVASSAAPGVAGNPSVEVWYVLSPTTSAASQTYTATFGAATPSAAMRVVVLGSTTTLDTTATLSGSLGTDAIALTTATSDEIVLTAIAVGVDNSLTTVNTTSMGDFRTVLAQAATPSASTQLNVIFESRPGARTIPQQFTQTGSSAYVAAAVAITCPLPAFAPGSIGISPDNEVIKDPGASLDFVFNWINWLSSTETISTSQVFSDSGISVDYSVAGANYVTAWLSGGTSGNSYTVTNRITTSLGRTDDRSMTVAVRNK